MLGGLELAELRKEVVEDVLVRLDCRRARVRACVLWADLPFLVVALCSRSRLGRQLKLALQCSESAVDENYPPSTTTAVT